MDVTRGAGLKLDRSLIPESLHPLIVTIEKWGFESQADQDEFVSQMRVERPDEVSEFNRVIDDSRDAIVKWGNSIAELDQHKSRVDESLWNHPYWSFLAALKIREITTPSDSAEAVAARLRMSAEARLVSLQGSIRSRARYVSEQTIQPVCQCIRALRRLTK